MPGGKRQDAIKDYPSGDETRRREGKKDGSVSGVGTGRDKLGIECEGKAGTESMCLGPGKRAIGWIGEPIAAILGRRRGRRDGRGWRCDGETSEVLDERGRMYGI